MSEGLTPLNSEDSRGSVRMQSGTSQELSETQSVVTNNPRH